jgi:hypothetical protein
MSERTSLLGGGAAPRAAPSFLTSALPAHIRALLCGKKAITYESILSPASGAVEGDLRALCAALGAAQAPGGGGPAARAALEALWASALGGSGGLPCPPAVSPQWGLLGFQGADPSRDLRSGTFPLALALASAGLRAQPALRREALLAALGAAPPFALCLLSTVHMLACHLKLLPAPPSFCPCCGAAVREREYGRLAAQSHRGASLRGFVELVREAGRGGGGGGGGAGERALGEVLHVAMRFLGEEWRRQGRGEGALIMEADAVLLARVQAEASAAPQPARGADTRHLAFPAMLSAVQRRIMDALAQASLPSSSSSSSSSGSSAAEVIRRSQSEAGGVKTSLLGGGGGGGSSYHPPLHASSGGRQAGMLSPLHAALEAGGGAGGGSAPAWGGPARRSLQDMLARA